jgi:uncharacterized protein (TIGR03437 family)
MGRLVKTTFVLILLAILLGPAASTVHAQGSVNVPVTMSHPKARFRVDGREYQGQQVFTWPTGSNHVIEFFVRTDGLQYNDFNDTRFQFKNWRDPNGLIIPGNDKTQILVAAPGAGLTAEVGAEYRVIFRYFGEVIEGAAATSGAASPAACGAPGAPLPFETRPGLIYVDGTCYWNSVALWLQEGEHVLNAFPYPGFSFLGWVGGQTQFEQQFRKISVVSPLVIVPRFTPAKRVIFRTEPRGLRVVVDSVDTRTSFDGGCDALSTIPPGAPPNIRPLCLGEFDFAPNSTHVIGAVTPQLDELGRNYVFDGFSNGLKNNSLYTVGSVTTNNAEEIIIANFVRGVSTVMATNPSGLKLTVNGRESADHVYFLKPGTAQTVSAPLQQRDANGRLYTFKRWSNGGTASQEVTVPNDPESTFRLVAEYELMSQLVVRSTAAGVSILVDGVPCDAPCVVDKPSGTEVTLEALHMKMVTEGRRVEFDAWSDGEPRVRQFILSGTETANLEVRFRTMLRLVASADPADTATFTFLPPSPDGFYLQGTYVTVTAEGQPGFKFRRWAGDLAGTQSTSGLNMSGERAVRALMDKVPFIPPASVRNAAADTATGPVAPASVIAIAGQNLAADYFPGPENPLAQVINGVSAAVDNFYLLGLKFVSPNQINAVLPYDLEPGEHTLSVRRVGYPDVNGKFQVASVAPGLFQTQVDGRPFVVGFRPDGSSISPSNPALPGEDITVLGTGFGRYQIRPVEGFSFPQMPAYPLQSAVEVFVGEQTAEIKSANGQPGQTAVVGVRFTVPRTAAQGALPLKTRVEGVESPVVLLPVGARADGAAEAGAETGTAPEP